VWLGWGWRRAGWTRLRTGGVLGNEGGYLVVGPENAGLLSLMRGIAGHGLRGRSGLPVGNGSGGFH